MIQDHWNQGATMNPMWARIRRFLKLTHHDPCGLGSRITDPDPDHLKGTHPQRSQLLGPVVSFLFH